MKKIVYVVGGLYSLTGMNSTLTRKINWLAENTDYDLYMILTEKANLPWVFDINPKVKWVNFDINFDELDPMPLLKKSIYYVIKKREYKKLFKKYLTQIRPDITVSIVRREINFINDIKDGSKKVGEIHFTRSSYRKISIPYCPQILNHYLSKLWMNSLIRKLKKLDKFVTLTKEDFSLWTELTNKEVIPNFVPEYKGEYAKLDTKNAIAVGRYSWEKGFDLLVDIWSIVNKKHPDWTLNIYGAGNYSSLQEEANKKGLEKVFICHPATKDIYSKYKESSIFLMTSRYEAHPLVLLEAMSVGLPPVAFACPCGPRDIINKGENGILVEMDDINSYAKGVCELIENYQKRSIIAKNAIKKTEEYPKDAIMKKWIDLFDSL